MCEIETGVQIAHRMVSRTSLGVRCLDSNLLPEDGGPFPGELVEISGKTNCGKSVLMLELIARIILPVQHGGHGVGAVFVNCDNNVHMLRLLDIMEKQIVNNSNPVGRSLGRKEINQIREESFTRLTMIKCCTMDEFEFTLVSLNDVFLKHPASSFLLIDSLVAFYWNKCTEKNLIRMDTYLKSLCVRLEKLCKELQLVAIFTRPSYFGAGRESTTDGVLEGSSAAVLVAATTSAFGSSSSSSAAAGGSWKAMVKHRIELVEAVLPTPSEDRKFNAFVTSREKQLIKFFMIDGWGKTSKPAGQEEQSWGNDLEHPINVAQCHRCQKFGHGSRNCYLQPCCVKCGETHLSETCSLPRKADLGGNANQLKSRVKCANCGGNHTSNYRGCAARKAYLEEQAKRKKSTVSTRPPLRRTSSTVPAAATVPNVYPAYPPGWERSYARVAASGGGNSAQKITGEDLFTLPELFALAGEMLSRFRTWRNNS